MSSTLPTRMGLAVPSLVEASRGLPSVKPPGAPTDNERVTFVAIAFVNLVRRRATEAV